MNDPLKEKELSSEEKQNNTIRAYKEIFTTEDGRAVLEDLKRKFNTVLLERPIDPYRTHIQLGAMRVCDYIMSQIDRNFLETEQTQ